MRRLARRQGRRDRCGLLAGSVGAPGLDFFAGMGEHNAEAVRRRFDDPEGARREVREQWRKRLEVTGERMLDAWKTLLSDTDARVLSGE